MGEFTTLMARDGHEFNAWLTPPSGAARGAVVIAQEIFGVNHHIRGVADGFLKPEHRVMVEIVSRVDEIFDAIARWQAPPVSKWLTPPPTP